MNSYLAVLRERDWQGRHPALAAWWQQARRLDGTKAWFLCCPTLALLVILGVAFGFGVALLGALIYQAVIWLALSFVPDE
jgi:hypothetical protein